MKLGEGATYCTWLAIKCAAGGSNQRGNWGVKWDEIKMVAGATPGKKSFGEALMKP